MKGDSFLISEVNQITVQLLWRVAISFFVFGLETGKFGVMIVDQVFQQLGRQFTLLSQDMSAKAGK